MPVCVNCNTTLAGKSSIQCDCCRKSIHLTCSGLQDDRITRNKAKCIKIVCNNCSGNIEQFADLKRSFDELTSSLLKRIDGLEKRLQEVNNGASPATAGELTIRQSEVLVKETIERLNRSKNVIIRGVPERAGSRDERRDHDAAKVSEILDVIGCASLNPLSVVRLGKPSATNENTGRPRAMKVIFADRSSALNVLKNGGKLRNVNSYRNCRILDDKTPEQIKYLEDLREELKRRTDEGEQGLTIKYVKGSPDIVKTIPKK